MGALHPRPTASVASTHEKNVHKQRVNVMKLIIQAQTEIDRLCSGME